MRTLFYQLQLATRGSCSICCANLCDIRLIRKLMLRTLLVSSALDMCPICHNVFSTTNALDTIQTLMLMPNGYQSFQLIKYR